VRGVQLLPTPSPGISAQLSGRDPVFQLSADWVGNGGEWIALATKSADAR
jgi:hypothetical protein